MGRKRRVKNTTKFDSKNSSLKQALTQNKDLSERLEAITASIAPPVEAATEKVTPPTPKKTTTKKTTTKTPKRASTRKKKAPATKSKTSTTK
tara:strand:+ start:151 stop:426 length:276 start_codon:yes stop_codon:yes gene_type:complete